MDHEDLVSVCEAGQAQLYLEVGSVQGRLVSVAVAAPASGAWPASNGQLSMNELQLGDSSASLGTDADTRQDGQRADRMRSVREAGSIPRSTVRTAWRSIALVW